MQVAAISCPKSSVLHGRFREHHSPSSCWSTPVPPWRSTFYFWKTYFIWVSVLPSCMYVLHVCVWYLWRSREGIRFPRTWVMHNCGLPRGFWELNPGSVQEKGLLTGAISPALEEDVCDVGLRGKWLLPLRRSPWEHTGSKGGAVIFKCYNLQRCRGKTSYLNAAPYQLFSAKKWHHR